MKESINLERAFRVDCAVPLFRMFGDQTGLLSYKCSKALLKNALELVQILVNCKPKNAQ